MARIRVWTGNMEETFEDTTRFTQAIVHNMLRQTLAENNYVFPSSFSPFLYPSNLSAICPILLKQKYIFQGARGRRNQFCLVYHARLVPIVCSARLECGLIVPLHKQVSPYHNEGQVGYAHFSCRRPSLGSSFIAIKLATATFV